MGGIMRCKGCQGKWGEVKVREDVKSARDMFYTFLLFWVFSMLFYVTAVLKNRTPIYLPPPHPAGGHSINTRWGLSC